MKSSKAVKSIKRKDPISKKKLAKKSSKINEFRDITPQSNDNPFWSDKIKFKEGIQNSELAKGEPKMMSVEEINKRMDDFENKVEEKRNKGESFTITFVEVADLVDNVFIFHKEAAVFLRLAVFVFKYFAHVDESFFEVASKLLQASIIADPENYLSHYWQGRFHEFQNSYPEARASFELSLMLKPSSKAYTALGLIHGKEHNFREAIKVLLKAIEVDPEDITAMINLGSVYLGYEKIDVALKWTQKAVDIDPTSVEALLQYAFLLTENQQPQDALGVYQKALVIAPNNSTIYERMSDVYMSMEEMSKAKECLDAALKIEPHNVQIINRIGQFAMAQENDINSAIKLFNKAMGLSPKDSVSYNNMGIAMTEIGDLEKAKSYYLKAISLAPEASDPRLNYAQVLNQEGNAVEAIATLQGFKAPQKREQQLIEQILEALRSQVKQQRAQTWDSE